MAILGVPAPIFMPPMGFAMGRERRSARMAAASRVVKSFSMITTSRIAGDA